MEKENCSSFTKFLLLGITNNSVMEVILFIVFLLIYLMTLVANIGMIVLIRMDPQLHTPMYFFLSHLSFSDLCYSTAVGPKMLVDLLAKYKSISFIGCVTQFFFTCFFIDVEGLLLAVMAFDRYKAISNPLMYVIDMSRSVCYQLLAVVYLLGLIDTLMHTIITFGLCFCGSNEINHFFCDIPPILLLSCSDTQVNELAILMFSEFIEMCAILGLLVSYFYILSSVLKISSTERRFKAFSTCASHLTSVAIFQGTLLFIYFRPSFSYSLDQDKIVSLFYTLVIPMFNPLIYSLRNKDVKEALYKLTHKTWFK